MNRDSALFLRTDQFTSSVRIGTLFEYLLYVKLAEDLLFSVPRGSFVFYGNLRWLKSLLCDVTWKPSCHWWSWLLCWTRKLFVSSCYYYDNVLNAFGWFLQPDGEARVHVREQTSKSRGQSEERKEESVFSCCGQF